MNAGSEDMSERYAELVRRLRAAVLEGSGVTDAALRQAVEAQGAMRGDRAGEAGTPGVPAVLRGFVDKVARQAVAVTQGDVDALRQAGYSEDAIFEIAASACVGAGLGRLERGMAALRGGV